MMTRAPVWSVFVLVLCGACGSTPEPAPPPPPAPPPAPAADTRSLYERLGGKPAIEAVVDKFLGNVAADGRVAHRFAMSDIGDVRNKLVDQICQATGGPCVYKGRDMKAAHKNQHITDADFTAVVEDLIAALDHFKVPEREKTELLTALASMQGDIVGQ